MKDVVMNILLTHSQRMAIAELFPPLKDDLELDIKRQTTIEFTVPWMNAILWSAGEEVVATTSSTTRNSLRCIISTFRHAIKEAHGIGAIPPSKRLYQFKITLLHVAPAIWRRIQVRNESIDKLHQRVQTAMGWKNCHLYRFEIQGLVHADPELFCDDPDSFVGVNSLETKISDIVPQSGDRFRFSYEYDFGDRWRHEILFEGCLTADQGVRYPLCLEGEGACPPEDVGGVDRYKEFLKAVADPADAEHEEWVEWAGGAFDPACFDAEAATRRMQRGLPDWRKLAVADAAATEP